MTFKAKIEASEIERLSVAEFGGEICVIDHISEEYFKAVEYLKKQKILGFDTETKPTFTANERRNRVALLQLSGADKAFIFRLIKLGIPDDLAKILSNARIKKVRLGSVITKISFKHSNKLNVSIFLFRGSMYFIKKIFDRLYKKDQITLVFKHFYTNEKMKY